MKFVGLVAPKSGGKDTVYDILKDQKRATGKVSFAGPLKEICSKVFNIPMAFLNDPVHKERELKEHITLTKTNLRMVKNECVARLDPYEGTKVLYNPNKASIVGLEGRIIKTPRELMQIIGTNFIRERIYSEWHVRAAFSDKALEKLTKSGLYCVTDCRFPNEYEFLKNKFGDACTFFYVERPEAEELLKTATHDSELGVLKIKAQLTEANIIKNDGTLDDLKKLVKTLKLPEGEAVKPGKKRGFQFIEK
jgi:hypothetical protein